jgi:hypothetical protein
MSSVGARKRRQNLSCCLERVKEGPSLDEPDADAVGARLDAITPS